MPEGARGYGLLLIVASLLLAACNVIAPATPTPSSSSPTVNGEVDTVDGRTVTVATNIGLRKIEVPEAATILSEGQGTAADLAVGALVGVTGKPDGTAVSIRMFPPGATPRTGQFPMTGAQAGNVMTNAKIEAFDGSKLTLDMNGEKASITVPPETEILKSVPASFSDIALGERVLATGTVNGDTMAARTVMILGAQRGAGG